MIGLRAIEIARDWVGTPYCHQASTKGAGCDCLGLLRGVWRELYGFEPELPPPYSMDWDEVAGQEVLWSAATRHLVAKPLQDMCSGDVILFRMRRTGVAKHLGICSARDGSAFLHSYSGHGVVESAMTDPWRRKIAAVFSFPDID